MEESPITAFGGTPLRGGWLRQMIYWVYILWSDKLNRYYVGSTSDIQRRLKEHNAGKSGYTKMGIPWKLVYQEPSETKKIAWQREMEIKKYKGGIQFKKLIG